jgi:hypothetical protein
MCGTGRVSDRDPSREAGTSAECAQVIAEPLLTAMQVIAAGQVEPEPVWRCRSGDRRPASHCQERQMIEQARVCLRLGHTKVEVRHQCPRMRCRHAHINTQRHGLGASRNDLLAPPHLAHEGHGNVINHPRSALDRRLRDGRRTLERMLGRLRAPA